MVIKSAKQRVICYELKTEVGEKRQVKLDSNDIFETSYEFDLRVWFCSYIGLSPSDPAKRKPG